MAEGYIADSTNYYQSPYYILPTLSTSSEVNSGIPKDALALVVQARGMTMTDPARDTITTTPFLTTSSNSYAVTDKDKTQGTYILGATAAETIDKDAGITARFTVITSPALINSKITDSFPNLSNLDIFMNAVKAGLKDVSNISIKAKSLEVTQNTIKNAGLWVILFVLVIPLAVLGGGFMFWLKRRKL
jgi:ABC-2 type transport system permease protein